MKMEFYNHHQKNQPEWMQLFMKHFEKLYGYACANCPDNYSPMDLMGDLLIKLSQSTSLQKGILERGLPYTMTSLKNMILDRHRRNKKGVQVFENVKAAHRESVQIAQSEEDGLTEEIKTMFQAVLTEEQYQIILLRAAGYKYGEIAEQLSIPSGTIANQIYRAKERIYRYLDNNETPPGEKIDMKRLKMLLRRYF